MSQLEQHRPAISQGRSARVYWANGLFSEADRRFNAACVAELRRAGFTVFLPQEAAVNAETSPSAVSIFRWDTTAVLDADVMVACLDQETIDCGVACEIGIAASRGIPIVGLYTDIRQHRKGPGRMYKNLYVLGAIEVNGRIVATSGDVADAINAVSAAPRQQFDVTAHYSSVAAAMGDAIRDLESRYTPPWSTAAAVERWAAASRAARVLDFGCGVSHVGSQLLQTGRNLTYVGYDASAAVVEQARLRCPEGTFTSRIEDLVLMARREPFDLIVFAFVLHDSANRDATIDWAKGLLRHGGSMLIIDLTRDDLPTLTESLTRCFGRKPIRDDPRLTAEWLALTAQRHQLSLAQCSLSLPRVKFASAGDVQHYLELFGILDGMDLPLVLTGLTRDDIQHQIQLRLAQIDYPFEDQRVFVECLMTKN